jgi:hypothetical protein
VFLLVCLGFATVHLAEAQQKKIPRIGYLAFRAAGSNRADTFRQGLRQLGYAVGKDIVIEYRFAEGKLGRLKDPSPWKELLVSSLAQADALASF